MKIGIDISQIIYGTGVSEYTKSLVKTLLEIDKENEYILFGSSLRQQPIFSKYHDTVHGNYSLRTYSFPPLVLEWLWNRLHIISIEKLTGKIDLFHTSDWLEPPAKCPKVTTIHDLTVFKYPEAFAPKGGHNILTNVEKKLQWVKKESAAVIAVSNSTKRDIIEFLKIPEEKIKVIYEAASEKFQRTTEDKSTQVKKKYKIEGEYLLSVSTLEPRKNLKRIIESFKILRQKERGLVLVLVGKYGWGNEKMSNVKCQMSNVKILGYIEKEDLAGLYSGAKAFIYPSLYEGFGLPILEAMSCGCPVVTSNVSSMPEVAGEAAVLINPLSVESITEGIKIALKNRRDLIKKGYDQVKKFSWEKCAQETLKVYEEVVE